MQHARGLTALGGRNTEAYEHPRRLFDSADPAYHLMLRCYAVWDLVEASVYSGHSVDSVVVLEMETLARTSRSPELHAGLRYARALLALDADAEGLFEAALRADLARWPFARTRVQLAYSRWLRRQRRVAESREHLRAARDQLTPQELQIAQLTAVGLTNREIGEKLYLSYRTVSSPLHRSFPELEITARSALRAARGPPESTVM